MKIQKNTVDNILICCQKSKMILIWFPNIKMVKFPNEIVDLWIIVTWYSNVRYYSTFSSGIKYSHKSGIKSAYEILFFTL